MRNAFVFLLAIFSTAPIVAQTRVFAGPAIGTQFYEQSADPMRVTLGGDLLIERSRIGIEPAVEYTNRKTLGRFTAVHLDGTYRMHFGDLSVLVGAGPTRISTEAGNRSVMTWNAEAEIAFSFGRLEPYWRVRQYEYSFDEFRGEKTSPASPALLLGIRFRIR